jgi:hypothetical protein
LPRDFSIGDQKHNNPARVSFQAHLQTSASSLAGPSQLHLDAAPFKQIGFALLITKFGAAESIYKGELAHPKSRQIRDRDRARFVAKPPRLLCSRAPSDLHH